MSDIWLAAQLGKLKKKNLEEFLTKDPGLLDREDNSGITPLCHACLAGKASAVEVLLKNNADKDKKMGDGRTPIYLAAAAKAQSDRMVQLLIEMKPKTLDEPIATFRNQTPLMVALERKNFKAAKQLIEAGASLDAKDDNGRTPRDQAENLPEKEKKVIKKAMEKADSGKRKRGFLSYMGGWAMGVLKKFNKTVKDKVIPKVAKAAWRRFFGREPEGVVRKPSRAELDSDD